MEELQKALQETGDYHLVKGRFGAGTGEQIRLFSARYHLYTRSRRVRILATPSAGCRLHLEGGKTCATRAQET